MIILLRYYDMLIVMKSKNHKIETKKNETITTTNNFPTCWDELLNWTEETSFLFRFYLNNTNSLNDEKLSRIKFIPYIRKKRLIKNDDTIFISSMNDIERIEFFKEHVRKKRVLFLNNLIIQFIRYFSFSKNQYYILYIGCYSSN